MIPLSFIVFLSLHRELVYLVSVQLPLLVHPISIVFLLSYWSFLWQYSVWVGFLPPSFLSKTSFDFCCPDHSFTQLVNLISIMTLLLHRISGWAGCTIYQGMEIIFHTCFYCLRNPNTFNPLNDYIHTVTIWHKQLNKDSKTDTCYGK